jgi:hypothetical protein
MDRSHHQRYGESDGDLYIELLEDDEHRGRIERRNGLLVLRVCSPDAVIPALWLREILTRAATELKIDESSR